MRVVKAVVLLAFVLLLPIRAFAQASITGVVKDASGGVLPGASVEASSPALIEKVRTAVADGTGQYRIEDLRPGTYTITVSLQGFSTYKREGIELTGTFTATINADLKVGTVAETVTVTGETPVVDVQSASREITLSTDVVKSIPTVRSYNGIVVIVPGVVTNLNDTVTGTATTQFPIHGGRNNEGRLTIDGLNIGNPPGGNQPPAYIADVGNAQEVTFITSGGLGETETAGLTMNIVPKTGGNRISGSVFFSGTGQHLQSNNVTPELAAQGLPAATPLQKVYDLNAAGGGPIKQDKVWYYVNARTQGSTRLIAGVQNNLNAGDPSKWLYAADPNNQMYSDRTWENVSGRVTWQITPRNKFGAFWDEQATCRKCTGATTGITDPPRVTPEATGVGATKPLRVPQVTWTSPVTSRLLLDAGFGGVYYGWGNMERDPNPTRDLIRVSEQCAAGCANNGGIPGLVYRSQDFGTNFTGSWNWKASTSYVTGAHSFKVGYQGTYMTDDRTWSTNTQNMTFQVSNGVPNRLTESISPWINNARAGWHAFFVQEQYTRNRVTVQAALRFDRSTSWFPEQREGPSRFLPAQIVIPATDGVNAYKDVTPRFGGSWDVFGNGKTALKANIGKYLEGVGVQLNYANSNPTLRMPQTTGPFGTSGVTRSWIDANNNFVPDCDLLNPAAQDLRAQGKDSCGVISNLLFGQYVLTNAYDPALLTGWGVRSSDWDFGVTLQQQVMPRASLEVAYTRRWYHGFTVTDNLATANSDWTPYSITAPLDSRLPGGGGNTISGLYDVVPTKAGQIQNLLIDSSKYGEEYQYFNGLDITLNLRLRNGLTLTGGTSTGQTVADACAVRANLPELNQGIGAGLVGSTVNTTSPYCHVAYGVLTQARGLGSYVIPKIDVQVSGVFQSKPGALLAANYAAPATAGSALVQSLGRLPTGTPANITINLLAPGSMYGDRVNQLDFRIAKILKFGRTRTMAGIDLYNALNSNAILTYNNAFVPATSTSAGSWLQPVTILTGRLVKFSAEITF
ncbi:MAG TPA: TonB-dependent receptor [Vicinamibacterales bacterium]|nr:TonB-dependent receptor [Vicinamibacterales bacterium]